MQQPGLYFPFIHIRDESWLKAAALYWPAMYRLVPWGYSKHDTATALAFAEAGFLRDEDPYHMVSGLDWDLVKSIDKHADQLASEYSLERARESWDGQDWGTTSIRLRELPWLGWIHVRKLSHRVTNRLQQRGLATRYDDWVGVHPALAGAYMTTLATRLSERAGLQPLTDQSDLRAATPQRGTEAAIRLLTGNSEAASPAETYAMLAMQTVIPRDLNAISPERILRLREELAAELNAFRDYVSAQQAELANIATVRPDRMRLDRYADHLEATIETPLRNLEHGLKLHKQEPIRTLIVGGLSAAATGLAQMPPVVAVAGSTAAAIGGAWWQVSVARSNLKKTTPVGYLLDVRDRLTPKTLGNSISKLLAGTRS